jgi:aminoglycoside 6-adenylyltransferase
MKELNDSDNVINRLIKWGKQRREVRAMLLTSSRARPGAGTDAFSDWDVILVAEDIKPYRENESWLEDFGKVLVVYRDPIVMRFGFKKFIYVTQYDNGLKMDFTLWPVGLLKRMAGMKKLPKYIDDGYEVLFDKDGLTKGMKPPSYKAFMLKPPTEAEYLKLVEEFFSDVPYAVKQIRRGDIFFLNFTIYFMRDVKLRQMLEWQVEIEHGWSLKSAYYGKGLQKYCNPEIIKEIKNTLSRTSIEGDWEALFRIIKLFGAIARKVGKGLGYTYPEDLEKRVIAYAEKVKSGELP